MIGGACAEGRGERRSSLVGELIGVDAEREPRGFRGGENSAAFVGGENTALAENVGELGEPESRDLGNRGFDHLRDVALAVAATIEGNLVGAEVRSNDSNRMIGRGRGDRLERCSFGLDGKAVAALHLRGGRAEGQKAIETRANEKGQVEKRDRACRGHRLDDPAALRGDVFVGGAGETSADLVVSIARVGQVGVGVDETRYDKGAARVDLDEFRAGLNRRPKIGLRTHEDDSAAIRGHRGIQDDAEFAQGWPKSRSRAPQGRELADIAKDEICLRKFVAHVPLGSRTGAMLSPAAALAIRSRAMRPSFLNRPVAILGQSMPMASLVLIGFVVLGSALLSFLERLGVPSLRLAPLSPVLVLGGQIWRLVTWGLFEADGQNLVFGSLMLAVFGRDLASLWGGVRYMVICALIVASSGVLTTLLAFVWGDVHQSQYLTIWPLADALIVAWALLFPNRTILFMLMLPAAGKNLLYLTVGMTALFAVMYGFSNFAPHFLAMGLMYAYIRGGTALAAQLKLNRLLAPKRGNPGLRAVDGGKTPGGSGWVH